MMNPHLYVFPVPPDELRPNRRMGGHWGPLNKVRVSYALACRLLIEQAPVTACLEPGQRCDLEITAYLGNRQRCDPSDLGAWAKVAVDALVEAGVIADDSNRVVRRCVSRVERDASNPRLSIAVKAVPQREGKDEKQRRLRVLERGGDNG